MWHLSNIEYAALCAPDGIEQDRPPLGEKVVKSEVINQWRPFFSRARTRLIRRGLVLALVVAAMGALAACSSETTATGAAADSPKAGYVAGDGSFATWQPKERQGPIELVGTTYDGEALDLADWRGDVVVVNFWYAACPPCRAEAPDLEAIYEDYTPHGVKMLGVNPRDDAGTAQAFERSFAVPYPSLHDQGAQGVAAFEGLVPLQAMPTTVVIDTGGRVAARIMGQIDPTILRGLIDDTLAEAA